MLRALARNPLRCLQPFNLVHRNGYNRRAPTAMSHTYKWPRPSVTVDAAIVAALGGKQDQAQLLLIQRKNTPCQSMWALPGGFVDENECLDRAVARELQEETSIDPKDLTLFQIGAFGDKGRDPRGWCVTVAYAALVPADLQGVQAADDAAEAEWFPVVELPPLAFDHKLVVRTAFEKLAEHADAIASGGQLKQQLQRGAKLLQGPWNSPKG